MDRKLKFNESHEWIKDNGNGTITIGISDHAQQLLGDVVFVDLPKVGRKVKIGEGFSLVESAKVVSNIYAPVNGEIVEVNKILERKPELINEEPFNGGWIVKIKLTDNCNLDH
ncbi:glycine cleavage system protein GcvH, partial [Candidatus Enterovibrio escicola]